MENRSTRTKSKTEGFPTRDGKNAAQFSELLESIGTTKNDTKRDSAGAKFMEGWEQVVKTTASRVIGEKLIVCNGAVKR